VNLPDFSPWSDEDVERLLSLIESAASTHDIAQALGRNESDLQKQARFLGVLLPEHEETGVITRTADSSSTNSTIRYVPFRPRRIK
jgi:predicted transcriptional regulator